MKQFFVTTLAVLLFAGGAWADPAELIKQKAMAIRDNNNAQQGVTAPAPSAPATAPQPAAPSGPQGMSPAQQQLLDRLVSDLVFIKAGAPVIPDETDALVKDMATLTRGAVKPSKPALAKLASDLAAALAEKSIPARDMIQLVRDVNIVMNCVNLTPAKAQTFVAEAQQILKTAGVSETTFLAVATDLKSVLAEIQKSKPKLYQ